MMQIQINRQFWGGMLFGTLFLAMTLVASGTALRTPDGQISPSGIAIIGLVLVCCCCLSFVWQLMKAPELKQAQEQPEAWLREYPALCKIMGDMPPEARANPGSECWLMQETLDNAADAIVITRAESSDANGPPIVFANKAYVELAGSDSKSLYGKPARLLGDQGLDATVLVELHDTLKNGKSFRSEVLFYSQNYTQRWLDVGIFPLTDKHGKITHYAAFARDIANQKELEIQMRDDKEAAEAANLLKSEFLATMSHEIRTPLNGIIGMSNLLLDTNLDATQANHVDMLSHSAETLLQLINDILDLSKIEADKLELEPASFSIKGLIFEIAQMVRPQIQRKGLELVVDVSPRLPINVTADPGRLRQIILNLIGNAVKFTSQGFIRIYVEPVEQADGATHLLKVSIEDSGIGISSQAKSRIFNKFSQGDASTTRRYGGTGLGLAICKSLAKAMGGTIGLESEENQGSTFWFTFACEPHADVRLYEHYRKQFKDELENHTVIILDDHSCSAVAVERHLRAAGADCHKFTNLNRITDQLLQWHQVHEKADLIILDEELGIGTAFDVMPRIAQVFGDNVPPILLLTNKPLQGCHKKLARAGLSGAIEKPIRPSHLVRAAVELLRNRGHENFWAPHPDIRRRTAATLDDERSPLAGLQVLLAEDNPINAQIFTHIMERWGARVTVAGNGREAIDISDTMPFDIIFMDCQMPEVDGFEATQELRRLMAGKIIPHTPIIALTANAMKGDRERCLEAGMDDYLAKPTQARDIATTIRRWVSADRIGEKHANAAYGNTAEEHITTDDDHRLINLEMYNECADILGPSHGRVVADFMDRLGQMLQELAFAVSRSDYTTTAKLVHPFKSSAAQLGAMGVSEVCRSIEMRTREKQPNEVDDTALASELVQLREVADATAIKLRAMTSEGGKEDPLAETG